MSEKQVMDNSQNQNLSGAVGVEPQPQTNIDQAQVASAGAQVVSAQARPAQTQAKPEMQFNSAEIGVRKAQEAVANQQKQDTEKRKRDARKRQIMIIAGAVIAVVVIVVVIVALFGRKPQGGDNSGESQSEGSQAVENDTSRTLAKAREISEGGGTPDEVNAFFSSVLADEANKDIREEILLAQALYYYNNGQGDVALEIASSIDDGELEIGGRGTLYNMLALLYQGRGDQDLANQYDYRAYEIMIQLEGTGDRL